MTIERGAIGRIDRHGVWVGTIHDAAQLIKTRDGGPIATETYRKMPAQVGAPGVYTVDPKTGRASSAPDAVPSRDPASGLQEYDLDAVAKWQANRPRQGQWWTKYEQRTPLRHDVLRAIREGHIKITINGVRDVVMTRDGRPFAGRSYIAEGKLTPGEARANSRAIGDLTSGGLITVPDGGGTVKLTKTGRAIVARWDKESEAAAEEEAAKAERVAARRREREAREAAELELLAAVDRGEVTAEIQGVKGVRLSRGGQPIADRAQVRAINALDRAGAVAVPAHGGPLTLTGEGRQRLEASRAPVAAGA
jgi:hypothetical protein